MNIKSKSKKGIIGITLAAIMIASIFAAIAPSTTADVEPLAGLTLTKDTDPMGADYYVGDTVDYVVYIKNPYTVNNCIIDISDTWPNGTTTTVENNVNLTPAEERWYNTSYVIGASDVNGGEIVNTVHVIGTTWPDIGDINMSVNCPSTILSNPPTFEFDFDQACCYNMSFVGYANDTDGDVVNYSWDFGTHAVTSSGGGRYDNGTFTANPITAWCVFDKCEDVTVELSGYDDDGNPGTTGPVTVDVPCGPDADAKAVPTKVFSGDHTMVTFDGSGSKADTGLTITNYTWTFWDATNAYEETVQKEVDGAVGTSKCATLNVSDGHCYDEAGVCVPILEKGNCSLRLYGRLDEGAGDPFAHYDTQPYPENPAYTDPEGPFYPQNSEAPRKDFITFDPVIMSHKDLDWDNVDGNDLEDGLGFYVYRTFIRNDGKDGSEKIFKRMWYEPTEWYKDEDTDGNLDLVLIKGDDRICDVEKDSQDLHHYLANGWIIKPSNSDDTCGDIYAPSIKQEFTYMMLDNSTVPQPKAAPVSTSKIMIPAASWVADNGIDSFDLDDNGLDINDVITIESEASLGIDIDGQGGLEPLDPTPWAPLSGDETLVLTAEKLGLEKDDEVQFFDHRIVVDEVFGDHVILKVYYQGETTPPGQLGDEVSLAEDETAYFAQGFENTGATPQGPFFVQVSVVDSTTDQVNIKVGRMFGNTYANVGANPYWNQKQFYVDGVCYDVVAIMTEGDNSLLYVTFRQKLPKVPVEIPNHSIDLLGWGPGVTLPEMPQYNIGHTVYVDVKNTWWSDEQYDWEAQDDYGKIGAPLDMPALDICWLDETFEPRFKGELKEIYNESSDWLIDWFLTLPMDYTVFLLPPPVTDVIETPSGTWELITGGNYMVTTAFWAPEGFGLLKDGGTIEGPWIGQRFKFFYEDCTGPYFIERDGTLRIYGFLNRGAGNRTVEDPDESGAYPENPPYTDPEAPFRTWGDEIPTKDFVTFDPVIMSHKDLDWNNNEVLDLDEYGFYVYRQLIRNDGKDGSEKIFKRMWYEPIEVYKDEHWVNDVGSMGPDVLLTTDECVPLSNFNNPTFFMNNWDKIVPVNEGTGETKCDIYAPSIKQEFTYMMLDSSADAPLPEAAPAGTSSMMIPMASRSLVNGDGIDSFDADDDGVPDRVNIESEVSLGYDFDGDGKGPGGREPLDPTPGAPLSGDESVIFTLDPKTMEPGDKIQFFDHMIELDDVFGDTAVFNVYYTAEPADELIAPQLVLEADERACYDDRDMNWKTGDAKVSRGPFCIEVSIVDSTEDKVRVQVARMFGNTYANIGAHDGDDPYWMQKQFYVDGVCYNVVAIMTEGENSLLYITFRQKLPKVEIEIPNHSIDLPGWDTWTTLPEMPQYNMNHALVLDVQNTWTEPETMSDKFGPIIDAPALDVMYNSEEPEWRFHGELKEIYDNETGKWKLEQYQTVPYQYTGFILPVIIGEPVPGYPVKSLYLVTSAFQANESVYHRWDGGVDNSVYLEGNGESPDTGSVARLKFWFDAADNTDLYVNPPPKPFDWTGKIVLWYDSQANGGDGDGKVDTGEVVNAILDYLFAGGAGEYPFGVNGIYDRDALVVLITQYFIDSGGC